MGFRVSGWGGLAWGTRARDGEVCTKKFENPHTADMVLVQWPLAHQTLHIGVVSILRKGRSGDPFKESVDSEGGTAIWEMPVFASGASTAPEVRPFGRQPPEA